MDASDTVKSFSEDVALFPTDSALDIVPSPVLTTLRGNSLLAAADAVEDDTPYTLPTLDGVLLIEELAAINLSTSLSRSCFPSLDAIDVPSSEGVGV